VSIFYGCQKWGIYLAVIASVFFQETQVYARSLSAPISLNTTQVLPKGVRSARVGGVTTMVDSWYDGGSQDVTVASPLIQELSYERLLRAENDESLKLNIESQLKAKGIPLDTIAGTSLADLNTRVTATIPALAMGVTDSWTLAVAVPVVHTRVDEATSFDSTPGLQKVVDEFAQKGRGDTKTIESKLNDVIATELDNKGYLPLEDREMTEVGDINLISKLRLYNGYSVKWALTNLLVIPTGRTRAINRLIDPAAGDGQWDFGTTSQMAFPITSKFRLLHEVGYLVQLPDTQDTRIPVSSGEILSRDVDLGARRDMGDIAHTMFGMMYQPFNFLTLGLGYQAAYKQQDRWQGDIVDPSRYELIGQFTEQYMQAAILQVGATSVQAYRAKQFPIPLTANLTYSRAFDGRHVRNNNVWSANVSLYF